MRFRSPRIKKEEADRSVPEPEEGVYPDRRRAAKRTQFRQRRADSEASGGGFHAKTGIFGSIILYLHKKILYLHTLSEQESSEACPERWVSG